MRRTSVTFVVTEVLGSVKNGGIATATTNAALVLADHGFDVELLYCGHASAIEPAWMRRYDEGGVRVRWLDRAPAAAPTFAADSYRLYRALGASRPDVAVVQDWLGLGFCAAQAKRAGELDGVRLVHICHGPTPWLQQANRRLDTDVRSLAVGRMERTSAEGADVIVSPSRHLLDWMLDAGWALPEARHVIPYFTEGHVARLDRRLADDRHPTAPLRELVFFGRLEERKGVKVFVDALNEIDPALLAGRSVTFLGREATVRRGDVLGWLDPSTEKALDDIRFEGDLDQGAARAYLREPGRMAVIPSLLDNSPNVIYECIEDRVPFAASDAGGNGELVHESDRAATLFEPTPAALAAHLATILEAGVPSRPARPAFDGPASLAAWRRVLDPRTGDRPEQARRRLASSDVTIVIPHHDGGAHVREAVASAMGQREPVHEVIIVDDGSTDAASLHALAELESSSTPVPLRVLRQPNRYLGAARNTGLQAASTPLVAFLDDDDVLQPDCVAALLEALGRNPAATAAVPTLLAIDVDPIGDLGNPADGVAWLWLDADPALGPVWNAYGGAGMIVDKQAVLDAGGFHERMGVGHEDWELLLRLALRGASIVAVPAPLYHYRIRPGSMIRRNSTWANMQPVFEAYAPHLPDALARWPEVLRGQHEQLEHLRAEVGWLHAELDRLYVELERRTRWFELRDRRDR